MIYLNIRHLTISLLIGSLLAIILLLGLPVIVQGADESNTAVSQSTDLATMSIEQLMSLTVTTSGKKPETLANTAAAVFVITSDDIERYGYQTLTQALRQISGFYSETDRYISFIGVRGFLPNSDLNTRVLVLVDGHKVNDYLYGQAPIDQDLPVDMKDIKRIEVVKGPGSALWGSEALLCVINCITKTASDVGGLEIRQDLGWRKGQHLAYGKTYSGGLEVTATLSGLKSDGQRRIYFPEYDTPEKNNGIAVGLDGERVGRGSLGLSYKGLNLVHRHVSRVKDVPTAYWWSAFNEPGLDVNDERQYYEISYENQKPLAGDGKLFCRAYKDTYDCVLNWENGDFGPDNRSVDQAKSWGVEARYSRNISSDVSAILGGEYLQAKANKYYFQVDPYLPKSHRIRHARLLSFYMQTDWDVSERLRLVAGTRMDDHSIFGENWSPRLAAIYKESPKSTLKLLYGEAFRAPSMSETGGDDNPKGLHPEKIKTYELVWDRQITHSSHLVTSLFSFDMRDTLLMTPSWDTLLGSVISKGIETQLQYDLHNGGSGYFGLSVVDADNDDPSFPLPSSPRLVATCGQSIPVFDNKANLGWDIHYMSKRKTMADKTVGSAAIANLALTSESLIKGANVSLGISNLFNVATYAPPQLWNSDGDDVPLDQIPQGGRTVQLQISCHL